MNILTQFQEILTNNLKNNLNNYLCNIITGFTNPYTIDSYKQFVEEFDKFTANFAVDSYINIIKELDEEFMRSNIRKQIYDSKGFITKSLLTKFGYINLKRRRYIDKDTGKSFVFVDRFLGLQKYSRMDPFIIGDLCEEASNTSYSKAGKIVSLTIGTKIKYNDNPSKCIISRATARNNVIKASNIIKQPPNDKYKEIEELTIMLDEKFVGSQFNEGKDHMVKAAVVFEGTTLEYKNRHRLTGKQIFGSIEDDLLSQVLDYIYYNYDTDKLKTINFLGDGALWIKTFSLNNDFKYHKDIITRFGLDHFHLAQAIQHITTNKHKDNFGKILTNYVINNCKEDFITVCESLISLDPYREETIRKKMEYILSNWIYIQSSYHDIKYKCSMESNISHVFADIFTSRPKAYSTNGLKSLLKIRLLKINGYDLKKLYFDSLKITIKEKKDKVTYNESSLKSSNDLYYLNTFLPVTNSNNRVRKVIRNLSESHSI